MDGLDKDDLEQLLTFYRQRCSELEFQSLQLQIKLKKFISEQTAPVPATKTIINKNNKNKE